MRIAFTPRHWSIRAKGVLVAIGYLLALSGVYSTFTIYLYRREAEQAYDRFEQTARIVAGDLDAYVANGEQRLRTVTRLPGLAYGLQTIQEARPNAYIPPWTTLHYLFFKSPVFTGGVFLLDRAGKVLWTEPPGLPWHGETLTDIEPVAAMYETRRGIVSAVLAEDRLLARPHVIIGVPVENETGEMQGVLAGIVDLTATEFRGVLAAVSTTAGRFVEVLDQRGVVLAGTDPSRLFRRSDRYGSDGEEPMLASLSLSRAPWRVVAGQPRSLGLAAVRRLQRALWGIGGALLIVAAAIATPILNGFVRSIKQLTQAAETVARGDLTQPVTVGERSDEIGTLARSFELMRVQLESLAAGSGAAARGARGAHPAAHARERGAESGAETLDRGRAVRGDRRALRRGCARDSQSRGRDQGRGAVRRPRSAEGTSAAREHRRHHHRNRQARGADQDAARFRQAVRAAPGGDVASTRSSATRSTRCEVSWPPEGSRS